MKRLAIPLLLLPITALFACTPNAGTTATPPASTAPSAPAGSTTPSPPSPGSTKATDGPTKTAGTDESNTMRCHTADLSATLGGGDSAAGSQRQFLVFTNKSNHDCTLYGYPGVSWVTGDQGTQVNDAFQRIDPQQRKDVLLATGRQANVVLLTHTAENYPLATCKPIAVRGLRVYPPDENTAIFVPQTQTACSVHGIGVAQMKPLTAGSGS